jgi:hypothetical protein
VDTSYPGLWGPVIKRTHPGLKPFLGHPSISIVGAGFIFANPLEILFSAIRATQSKVDVVRILNALCPKPHLEPTDYISWERLLLSVKPSDARLRNAWPREGQNWTPITGQFWTPIDKCYSA